MTASQVIKRGELARRSGCNLETIRYYENIGLLQPPERTASGHRLYPPGDQARLGFILRGRDLGFSIEELKSQKPDGALLSQAEIDKQIEEALK